jgi:hypothetical protein
MASVRAAGYKPWTVSVAIYPGDTPCPELETLDLVLSKERHFNPEAEGNVAGRHWDPLFEAWKAKIEWPEEVEYGPPVFLPIVANLIREKLWADWEDYINRVTLSLGGLNDFLDEKAK